MSLVLIIRQETNPDGFRWVVTQPGAPTDIAFSNDLEQSSAGALGEFFKFADDLLKIKGKDVINDHENSGGT